MLIALKVSGQNSKKVSHLYSLCSTFMKMVIKPGFKQFCSFWHTDFETGYFQVLASK